MSTPSARLGFARPSQSDPAHLNNSLTSMEDTLDQAAMWASGTYGLRPPSSSGAPGIKGRIYLAEDVGDLFYDMGTGWRYMSKKLGEMFALPAGVSANMITDGLLPCDGRLVAKVGVYANLFALIGHSYNGGVDPGSGNFRIPDLRGRAAVGADDAGTGDAGRLSVNQVLGASGGEEKHQLTINELAAHPHTLDPGGAAWWIPKSDNIPDEASFAAGSAGRTADVGAGGHVDGIQASAPAGGDTPHNNMQPFQIVTWAIRAA